MASKGRLATGAFAYALFIVYGSLVPLDYRPMPSDQALDQFSRIPFLRLGVESRADWIANGVLYFPLGALLTVALRQARSPAWFAMPVAWIMGFALALAVEFAQLYFPPRTVSLNDLMAEGIGLALGAFAGLWLARGGAALPAHGLAVYAALYVAYALFPFDVLISAAELERKLVSDLWGWWLAGQGRRPLISALLLGVEAALTAPIGAWLLGQRVARGSAGSGAALLAALAFGLLMEGLQLVIASGVTQGASVLARTAGFFAGAALWRHRGRLRPDDLRALLAPRVPLLALAYAVLLVAVNGWFVHDWEELGAAAATWSQVRLLPFYYHYYTSEAQALVSLTAVAMMYAPIGALAWARGAGVTAAGLFAALAAFVIEASKLFLAGQKPDPTNVLIALAAAAGVVVLAGWAQRGRPAMPSSPEARAAGTVPPSGARVAPRAASPAWLVVPVALLAWHLVSAPPLALASAAVALGGAVLVWRRPVLALALVPALLPVLDLAPWTGRRAWDEFDLLLGVCLAVAFARVPPAPGRRVDGPWLVVFALFTLSFALSVLRALFGVDLLAEGLAGYHGAYEALRVAKGLLWAALFVALARRVEAAAGGTWAAFSAGMRAGLAWVVLVVLWERAAFVGLFDFASDYRTTGPFSAMHRGGAFVECYLALATPFAAAWLLEARRAWARAAAVALLAGAGYAMFVTYSRNGYGAMAVGLVVWLVLWARRGGAAVPGWRLALVPAVVAAAALPVLIGPYAKERLANWQRDLAVRQAHWGDALAMRDAGVVTGAFGMGVGRFAQVHFWNSGEAVRAATYRVGADGGRPFLQLGGGALTYLDQIVSLPPRGDALLSIDLRASRPGAAIGVSICEKWMLTSRRCAEATVRAGAQPDEWARAEAMLGLDALRGDDGGLPRSVKFALHSPAPGVVVDVRQVALRDEGGRDLIANGDFARGLDRWLFSTNEQQPYQIDSLPVTVLFGQGWFGLFAWALLLAAALSRGVGQAWQGSGQAAVAVAALAAFLASGLLNTLVDEPRFLWLLVVLAWWCCVAEGDTPRRQASRRAAAGGSP